MNKVMPKLKDGAKYIHKTISIREDQVKFIESESLNLSRFVQNKIDEKMGKRENLSNNNFRPTIF
jgi:hypothetical protein